jgi:hypothetical protein
MKRSDPYLLASLQGEQVIRERGISAFPVDPVGIARDLDIEVVATQAHAAGVWDADAGRQFVRNRLCHAPR